ncbi:Sensor histidine kinase LiaS [compost metagenome]
MTVTYDLVCLPKLKSGKLLNTWSCGILIVLLFLLSCRRPSNQGNTLPVTPDDLKWIDSLKSEAQQTGQTDSALSYYALIKQLARQKKYDEVLFDAYCLSAMALINKQGNFEGAKAQLDSISGLDISLSPQMEVSLDLRYGVVYNVSDSAIFFLKKSLDNPQLLDQEDKLLAKATLSTLFASRKNYDLAYEYAIDYLKENKTRKDPVKKLKGAVITLNNLYIIEQGRKDTAQAFRYLQQAIQLDKDSADHSMFSNVYQNMGKYYLNMGDTKQAWKYFSIFEQIIREHYENEYLFYPRLYEAEVLFAEQKYDSCMLLLQQAATIIDPEDLGDPPIQKEYFECLYRVYQQKGNTTSALKALERRNVYSDVLYQQDTDNRLTSYERERKQEAADKAIAAKEQKIERQTLVSRFLIAGCILLLILIIVSYLYWRNKKALETQKLKELEQRSALERARLLIEVESKERKRIARELHDEIGSTLTTIGLAVQVLKQNTTGPAPALDIIERNSRKLTLQAKEIVWSLNDSNDNLASLLARIRHYCVQFLSDVDFSHSVTIPEDIPDMNIEGFKRRYIFQTIKEIVNNAVKHSQADKINVSVQINDQQLTVQIADNGTGMQPEAFPNKGNGLGNTRNNITAIGGTISWIERAGTIVSIKVPLP